MNDVCFVSVAFNFLYLQQLDRLTKSIKRIYPKPNLIFFRDVMPPGAKSMYDSLYGFKPHAIEQARKKGFKKIIWLDPAMILKDKVDDLIKQPTVIAIKDDTKLENVTSDRCYEYFGLRRVTIRQRGWHLVGGSLYFFNFDNDLTHLIFNAWLQAEVDGIFGSQEEQASGKLQGHRSDETVMAITMYSADVHPVGHDTVRYCIEKNPMFVKRHFK